MHVRNYESLCIFRIIIIIIIVIINLCMGLIFYSKMMHF